MQYFNDYQKTAHHEKKTIQLTSDGHISVLELNAGNAGSSTTQLKILLAHLVQIPTLSGDNRQ
jgi:hypothetical protein